MTDGYGPSKGVCNVESALLPGMLTVELRDMDKDGIVESMAMVQVQEGTIVLNHDFYSD